VARKLNKLSPSIEDAKTQKEDITKSLSFLNFSMLEASATHTFSGAMFYVRMPRPMLSDKSDILKRE
jgi:hypothetical protein